MKKLLIASILFGLLAFAILPGVTGLLAERVIEQLVSQANANRKQIGEIKMLAYERRYWSSNSRFAWYPTGRFADLVAPSVIFACQASHLLPGYRYQCKPQAVQAYTDIIKQNLNAPEILTVEGEISIFGTLTKRFRVSQAELLVPTGASISVQPAILTLVTDSTFSALKFSGEFGGFKFSELDRSLTVNDLAVSGDISFNQHNLVIGKLSVALDYASSGSYEDGAYSLHGLAFSGKSAARDIDLGISYQVGLDEFVHLDSQGVSTELENLILDFQMEGIDMAKMAILTEKLLLLTAQVKTGNNAYLLAMLPDFEKLLKPGLALRTNLSADYLAEPLRAEIGVLLHGNLSFADYLLLRVNPRGVFAKIEANLDTAVPQVLLDKHAWANRFFASSPWYTKSGRSLASKFHMVGEDISLNGRSLSDDELMRLIQRPKRKRR